MLRFTLSLYFLLKMLNFGFIFFISHFKFSNCRLDQLTRLGDILLFFSDIRLMLGICILKFVLNVLYLFLKRLTNFFLVFELAVHILSEFDSYLFFFLGIIKVLLETRKLISEALIYFFLLVELNILIIELIRQCFEFILELLQGFLL
jgi:hypothetical protein